MTKFTWRDIESLPEKPDYAIEKDLHNHLWRPVIDEDYPHESN
ncbi:hypothetical protein [Shewanella sp. CG_4_10_14_0_8_um_filter_42_13]|nr:hypothetical protein [Shewanella sp. CG_4_10_14_0_8_um_filter_42_13]